MVAVPPGGLIIQTIRLDPSGPDATDGPSHLNRPDPSGSDQIHAEHQATDLEMSAHQVSTVAFVLGSSSADRPREDGMGFAEAMDAIARGVEVLGIVTLVPGLAAALVRAGLALFGGQGAGEGYRIVRTVFGRSILLA